MASEAKTAFLKQLNSRYGPLKKLHESLSLYDVGGGAARVYIRYSRVHRHDKTFYGLREEDLRTLEGHPSVICFLWDGQKEPLLIPFSEYEDVFRSTTPAGDGQYKVQVYLEAGGTELYVARAGRFNVESHFGWGQLDSLMAPDLTRSVPELSHSQVQTLLGAIGAVKGYDIWIPPSDRARLDWSLASRFESRPMLPHGYQAVAAILQEVDVIWIERGSSGLGALYEVEHSTPIYSALLRLNDIHLVIPSLRPRFSVVANDVRKETFVRQLSRPTFRASGLSELCTFLDYGNVFGWYNRIRLG